MLLYGLFVFVVKIRPLLTDCKQSMVPSERMKMPHEHVDRYRNIHMYARSVSGVADNGARAQKFKF